MAQQNDETPNVPIKEFPTTIVLKITRKIFFNCFRLTMLINSISIPTRMQNVYFAGLTISLKSQVEKNKSSSTP